MKLRLLLIIAFAALTLPGFATFMRPQMIPVEYLLKNAETHLAAHPDSDDSRYILVRIHYLAFARCSESVPAFREADPEGKPSMATELDCIRAWFDSNSDAVSTSSEVSDLAELGIVGIRVSPSGQNGAHPTCANGLLLRDGKSLPTWDWMATPVAD